jgi:hypothetical protein
MNSDLPFSQRHGHIQDPEITIRNEAPDWLRHLVVQLAYDAGFEPGALRAIVCEMLIEVPDSSNWSPFPNIDAEVKNLLNSADWFHIYDLIELLYRALSKSGELSGYEDNLEQLKVFTAKLNSALRRKGVGWQLNDGKVEVRGPEIFEKFVHQAIKLAATSGRAVARQELLEALRDLSRRPEPEITGAIQHAMAALECIAKHVTGDSKSTLGEWVKKNAAFFPQPVGTAIEKLWGYSSQFGRHVREGDPADFDEAEMVVGLAGALSVYILRKASATQTK